MNVTAYLGLGSRYSYLASTQLSEISKRTGVAFDWVPINSIELIRLARADGSPFDQATLFGQYDPAYRLQDALRWAAHYDVPYHEPQVSALPPSALALACWCAPNSSARRALIIDIFDHVFAKGVAMDLDSLTVIAGHHGVSRREIDAALDGGVASTYHNAAIQEAVSAGVFGVPTFLHKGALFWGNDRLILLEDHLRRSG